MTALRRLRPLDQRDLSGSERHEAEAEDSRYEATLLGFPGLLAGSSQAHGTGWLLPRRLMQVPLSMHASQAGVDK
jgi:hypothetical protein